MGIRNSQTSLPPPLDINYSRDSFFLNIYIAAPLFAEGSHVFYSQAAAGSFFFLTLSPQLVFPQYTSATQEENEFDHRTLQIFQ